MFPAMAVALREGVEAALVVGIMLVYLNRTGRAALARYVWSGVALAALGSVAGALSLERFAVNQEGVEGVLMLLAAFFVVTMIWWMNRVARTLRGAIEQRVESYAQRATMAAGLGLLLFTFLMVLREGVETVIILRAVGASSEALQIWLGTGIGLAIAIAVGLLFFKGTLRIPLHRFFAATSTILIVVAVQLAITGIHELSEAMWIPSSKREMAIIGPIVRNDVFFFVLILSVAALAVLREWLAARRESMPGTVSAAEQQRWATEQRKQRRWMFAAGVTCFAVVLGLAADFLYAYASSGPAEAQALTPQNGEVRLLFTQLRGEKIHYYSVDAGQQAIRFLVIRRPGDNYFVGLDACRICGPASNRPDGDQLVCLNCGAMIPLAALDSPGGCNPVAVPFRVEGGELVIGVNSLVAAVPHVEE